MNIARALKELKLIDKRIKKETSASLFIALKQGKKLNFVDMVENDFVSKAKSDLHSIEDLIKNRQDIKTKIMISNAETKVVINKETMTVVEAIDKKETIKYRKELLNVFRMQLTKAEHESERVNTQVQENLRKLLESSFGKDARVKDGEYETISKPFLEQNEVKVVDPLELRKRVEELDKEIDTFESEVDYILAESNVKTEI